MCVHVFKEANMCMGCVVVYVCVYIWDVCTLFMFVYARVYVLFVTVRARVCICAVCDSVRARVCGSVRACGYIHVYMYRLS